MKANYSIQSGYLKKAVFYDFKISEVVQDVVIPSKYMVTINWSGLGVNQLPQVGEQQLVIWLDSLLGNALLVRQDHPDFDALSQATTVKMYSIPQDTDNVEDYLTQLLSTVLGKFITSDFDITVQKQ